MRGKRAEEVSERKAEKPNQERRLGEEPMAWRANDSSSGKLYVEVVGGFTTDACGEEVRCHLELDGVGEVATLRGRSLPKESSQTQLHQLLKNEGSGKRWWFGELANEEREEESSGSRYTGHEFVLGVKDYFGRIPISFQLTRTAEEIIVEKNNKDNMRTGIQRMVPTALKRKKQEPTRNITIGLGRAFLSDSLSFDMTHKVLSGASPTESIPSFESIENTFTHADLQHALARNSKRQVVRVVNSDGRVVACLVIEMCFIPRKAKAGVPMLHEAVARGQKSLVQALLSACSRDWAQKALTCRNPRFGNMNLFELAVFAGQKGMLRSLLSINSTQQVMESGTCFKGRNILHIAAMCNDAESLNTIVSRVLKHNDLDLSVLEGALDVQTIYNMIVNRSKNALLTQRDEDGRTPFMLCCALDQSMDAMPFMLSLLDFDPEISDTDNEGNTALILSIKAGQSNIALFLLNLVEEGPPGVFLSKAKPNLPNKSGFRALHLACQHGNLTLVKALLEAGAFSSLQAKDGTTPLHLAAMHGHLEIVQTLLEWPEQYRLQLIEHQEKKHAENIKKSGDDQMDARLGSSAVEENNMNQAASLPVAAPVEGPHVKSSGKLASVKRTVGKPFTLFINKFRNHKSKSVDGDQAPQDSQQEDSIQDVTQDTLNSEQPTSMVGQPDPAHEEDASPSQAENQESAESQESTESERIEEDSFNESSAFSEAISCRMPKVSAIQWSSGMTAAQLAKQGGHEDVFLLLSLHKVKEKDNVEERQTYTATTPSSPTLEDTCVDSTEESAIGATLNNNGIDSGNERESDGEDSEGDLCESYIYDDE